LKVFQKIFWRPGAAWLDQATITTQIAALLLCENVIQQLIQGSTATLATMGLKGTAPTLTIAITAVAKFLEQPCDLVNGLSLFGGELHTNTLDNLHNLSSFHFS
jgi:hypothetical protein